jgi:hypothetical protein
MDLKILKLFTKNRILHLLRNIIFTMQIKYYDIKYFYSE